MEDKKLSRKERRALEFGHSSPNRWYYAKAPIDISHQRDVKFCREESMLNARDVAMRIGLNFQFGNASPEDWARLRANEGIRHYDQVWTFTH